MAEFASAIQSSYQTQEVRLRCRSPSREEEMTDYRALAARLLGHGPAMREAAAALTEAAVEIEYLENSLKMGVLRDSEQEIKLWRERAEAAAIKDEPTT